MSLSITLHHVLVEICGVKKTEAAEIIGGLIDKTDRTVREGTSMFFKNAEVFQTESKAVIRGLVYFGKMRS